MILNKYTLKALSPFLWAYTVLSFLLYRVRQKHSYFTHFVFRKAFIATNGSSNDFISRLLKKAKPSYNAKGILSGVDPSIFAQEIDSKGYFVFDQKLNSKQMEEIEAALAQMIPMKLDYRLKKYVEVPSDFPKAIDSPRYQYMMDDLLNKEAFKKLYQDETIVNLATAYLKTSPVMDLLACWWSYPNPDESSKSAAAQLYHFDMDRLKFIKFFFYLTDVTENTGPHCYIESSHKSLPFSFHEDRRFTDEEVKKAFPGKERILTGAKGSIMAVDTRGLHKGLDLKEGNRLIFQIEFANSLFGKNY